MSSSRQSPPTERVVALLDHVLANPGRQFGLSELARTLDISKPTCLGILTTLSRTGWLVCDAQSRTYRIGPDLAAAGRSRRGLVPSADLACAHLARLAECYGTTCTASALVGDEIVLLARVPAAAEAPGKAGAGPAPRHLLAAATYDAEGREELLITLYVDETVGAAEISRRSEALMATAGAITAESGGTPPPRKATE
jgi:IclR-like helix-turn-helix domain-containing protein